MRDFVCQFGNCEETNTPIVVSTRGNPGERMRFCCAEHAARYLLRNSSLAGLSRIQEDIRELSRATTTE